eukprot:scaffold589_cov343-Prasinococcus_capsulatus_cf.AAC.6
MVRRRGLRTVGQLALLSPQEVESEAQGLAQHLTDVLMRVHCSRNSLDSLAVESAVDLGRRGEDMNKIVETTRR